MEGTTIAVGHIHEGGSALGLQGDGDLIRQLHTSHVPELSQETGGSPAVEAAAVDISRAIACCHSDQEFLDRVKAFVLLCLDGQVNQPATQ